MLLPPAVSTRSTRPNYFIVTEFQACLTCSQRHVPKLRCKRGNHRKCLTFICPQEHHPEQKQNTHTHTLPTRQHPPAPTYSASIVSVGVQEWGSVDLIETRSPWVDFPSSSQVRCFGCSSSACSNQTAFSEHGLLQPPPPPFLASLRTRFQLKPNNACRVASAPEQRTERWCPKQCVRNETSR